MGYHWIRLDQRGQKMSAVRKISSPDQCGRRLQVPVGPESGHPQESIFWEDFRSKGSSACKTGWCKVFPDIQDHLGQVKPQRHQGVGQEQGLPKGVNSWNICINKGCSGLIRMITMAILRCFPTARTIRVKSSPKDTKV